MEDWAGPYLSDEQLHETGRLNLLTRDDSEMTTYLGFASVRWAVSILYSLPEPWEFIRIFIAERSAPMTLTERDS